MTFYPNGIIALSPFPYIWQSFNYSSLSSVDVWTKPEESASETWKTKITAGEFLKPSKNTTIPLDFVDETLDQMLFCVVMLIVVSWVGSFGSGRNNHFSFVLLDNEVNKIVGIIAFVRNQRLKIEIEDERVCFDDVVPLPSGQDKAQRIAQAVDTDVDFPTEAASTATQGLLSLAPLLLGDPSCTRMSPHHCAIDNQLLHIWVSGKVLL